MEIVVKMFFVVLLVLINAFFVASEFSLVAVRKTRVDELVKKGRRRAKLLQSALKDLDSYISATQLGITLASLALGWIGEPSIAHFLEPWFSFLPETAALITSHSLATAIAFTIITVLHIVLGELAPKTIALQKAETTALIIIAPLVVFTKAFSPFIFFLNKAGGLVLKIIGFSSPSGHTLAHSEEEIKLILTQSSESGVIEKQEVAMMNKVMKFGDTPIHSIMIPRTEIEAFDVTCTVDDIITQMKKTSFSRFPVFEKTIDSIIGFIHVKGISKIIINNENKERNVLDANILHEIIHVPETKKIDDVLIEMRSKRIHMAVVNDEYGGTAGIVTIEDIIESLVGEIQDEFEEPFTPIKKQKNGTYLIDGSTSIDLLQQKFKLRLKGQGYTTIGGLIFGLIGRSPKKGDTVQIGTIRFEVLEMEGRRIKTISLDNSL